MEITETMQGEIKILSLDGRLDSLSSGLLDTKLQEITESSAAKIIVDFSNLSFISSSGLRVLLSAGKKIKSTNGKLALSSLQEHVKEVFDVAGFTMLFSIFISLEEAIKSLS